MDIAVLLIIIVIAIHVAIVFVEMFAWRKLGPKMFPSFPDALFEPTEKIAANQGLYNGFLAAGLLWATFIRPDTAVAVFFLACVFVAGAYGAYSISRKIFFVQALPAAAGIAALQAWPLAGP